MGEVEDKIIKLFRVGDALPDWWLAFLDRNGLRNARISEIQKAMHKEDGAFVVRITKSNGQLAMGERYLEFRTEGAKHFFLLKNM